MAISSHPQWQYYSELCQRCAINDPDFFYFQMCQLYDFLCEANQHVNLTRITSFEGFWTKHVMDSMLIAEAYPEFVKDHLQWGDLGCGAGFPSLVLATAFPKVSFTAIDSTHKKIDFVKSASKFLNLSNLTAVAGRGRELSRTPEFMAHFNVLTARAVGDTKTLIIEGGQMVNATGVMILYRTPEQVVEERALFPSSHIHEFSWTYSSVLELPENMGQRQFAKGKFLGGNKRKRN